MDIELLGFATGIIGAIWMKAAVGLMNQQRPHPELEKSLGREAENPALKAFLRGLVLLLVGLGLETYARLFC
ncbi:MAG: hypothetical protein ACREQ7_17325 [Candidatus Binatia bacterium]